MITTLTAQSTAAGGQTPLDRDTRSVITGPADVALKFWNEFEISWSKEHRNSTFDASSAQQDFSATVAQTDGNGGGLLDLPVNVGPAEEPHVSFHPLQEWEGYVTAVRGSTFTARLTDLTEDATRAEEEADFPTDDVVEGDRELLAVGRVFRWAVGYFLVGATRLRASHIVFRRLRWTKEELVRAEEEGRELAAKIKWE